MNLWKLLDELVMVRPGQNLTEDTSLVEDLSMDTLDITEFSMAIEDELDVDLRNEDVEDWATLGDVVKTLRSRHGIETVIREP